MAAMTYLFGKLDPRAALLLAIHDGTITLDISGGCNEWLSTEGEADSPQRDWLLSDKYFASAPASDGSRAAVAHTATGESLLTIIYGMKSNPTAPKATPTVGRDQREAVMVINADPGAVLWTNVVETHIMDVLGAPGH